MVIPGKKSSSAAPARGGRQAKSGWKAAFDNLVFVVALFTVLMTVPQAAKIWLEKDASGVSALSWFAYTVGAVFWMLYGIVHDDKHIIAIYALFTLVNASIVAGVLLFG